MTNEEKLFIALDYLNKNYPADSDQTRFEVRFYYNKLKQIYSAAIFNVSIIKESVWYEADSFSGLIDKLVAESKSLIENRIKGLYEEALSKQKEAGVAFERLKNTKDKLTQEFNDFQALIQN